MKHDIKCPTCGSGMQWLSVVERGMTQYWKLSDEPHTEDGIIAFGCNLECGDDYHREFLCCSCGHTWDAEGIEIEFI